MGKQKKLYLLIKQFTKSIEKSKFLKKIWRSKFKNILLDKIGVCNILPNSFELDYKLIDTHDYIDFF